MNLGIQNCKFSILAIEISTGTGKKDGFSAYVSGIVFRCMDQSFHNFTAHLLFSLVFFGTDSTNFTV
uniref:Uncharacterized protein n=1 Tax=Magallana gigas TaxID=29159 RepID=K1QBH1_MAGGI